MNNEIQFKRGEIFSKHPLKSDGNNKQSSDEEKNEKDSNQGQAKLSNFLVSQEQLQRIEQQMGSRGVLSPKSYNLTVEDINRRQTTPAGVNAQPSSAMIENFSKENYEYMQGELGQHMRPPINQESDDERHGGTRSTHIRNVMDGRVSGKTTAKGGPLSNEEQYEEDDEDDYKHRGEHEDS